MHASSRAARRFGVPATAVLALVLAGAVPALADDTTTPDTSAPVITSTGLTDGQLVPRVLSFHPVATDDVAVTAVTVYLGSNPAGRQCPVSATAGITCTVGFALQPNDADIDVTVSVSDAASNTSRLTTRVHTDLSPPTGTLAPRSYSGMRSGPVTVTISPDSVDIAKIDMTAGPTGPVIATVTAAPWVFTWNATETAAPPCFRLTDWAGNVTTYCSNYVVSDEPPVIKSVEASNSFAYQQLWISQLDDGNGWIGADGQIVAEVVDRVKVDHAELWVDGSLKATSARVQNPGFTWHDTTPGKTSANVEVKVWDTAGLTVSKAFQLNIDNVGPSMKVSPPNGTLVRGTRLTMTLTATDPHHVLLFHTLSSGTTDSASFTGSMPKDGPDSWPFLAYDGLGNTSWVTNTVIVDNTAPSVAFAKAPANNAHLTSTVGLTAATSDKNGISRVQLLVNGNVIATSSDPHHTFTLIPSKYGKRFSVAFRAYDKAGNQRDTPKRYYTYR